MFLPLDYHLEISNTSGFELHVDAQGPAYTFNLRYCCAHPIYFLEAYHELPFQQHVQVVFQASWTI